MDGRRQLRIYRIEPGRMAEFLKAWRDGVVPLRMRFGFEIEGAWAGTGDEWADHFWWVLRFDGEGTFEEADAAYYGSDERRQLADDPARYIVEQEHPMVEPVPGLEPEPGVGPRTQAAGPFDPPP
jgi:hypothetical protein